MKKTTMKARVLDFVESKSASRFTEIQEFIVDHNYGLGTYKAAAGTQSTYYGKMNPHRGYYSGAFYKAHGSWPWSKRTNGYFLNGTERLEKGEDGLYRTIR